MAVREGLHHRVSRRLELLEEIRGNDDKWEWLPVVADLEVTGLCPMWEYVRIRQNKISKYIFVCLIFEIFTQDDRWGGSIRFLHWWYQYPGQAEEGVE